MRLENKIAIVTGAASGIGKAIADLFVREGATVIYSDVSECTVADSKQTMSVLCDVSDSKQVEALVQTAVHTYGRLDIMVNNAGVASQGGILDTTDVIWAKTLAIDLNGVFFGMRAAGNAMKTAGVRGSIISTASIAGLVGFQGSAAYCASKGAVIQLTRAAALDLAKLGIRVNAIAPGIIETNMTKPYLDQPKYKALFEQGTPEGRLGQPDDIAFVALYLASDESKFVTGQTITVDGGWTAQ